jgi:hypothetical protein
VAVYGGTAGQQCDPCYHAACDTFANNNNAVLDLNSDAIALATLTYAMSTDTVTSAPAASALSSATATAATRFGQLPAE